jgi:hypothetical protein
LLFVWLHALQQEPKLQDVRAKGDSTIRRWRKLLGQSPSDERSSGNPRVKKAARASPERRKELGQSRATKAAWAIPEWRKLWKLSLYCR